MLRIEVLDLASDLPQRPAQAKGKEEREEVDKDIIAGEDELRIRDVGDRGMRAPDGRAASSVVDHAMPRLLKR